jgi:hypothetical protein
MQFIKIFKYRRKFFLITAHIALFNIQIINAQFSGIDRGIYKIKKAIGDATQIVYGLGWLANATTRTYTEFNQTVSVVKGTNTESGSNSHRKVTHAKIKDGKFTNIDWQEVSYFDGQLFPSSIICMSTYKGEVTPIIEAISRPLGFRIISKNSNVAIKWEIESVDKKYFDKVGDTYIYPQANKEVSLNPIIPWNYEALVKHETTEPLNVYFRLYDDKGNKVEKLITLSLRSINDCIFYYKNLNLQFMYATYVQEEHPIIDEILREALNTKMIDRWIGYQDSAKEVDLQIAAIWRVLHNRGFVYSSVTTTTGDNGEVHSQVVRTFNNALKTNQANCVDGTVVFASILRKIGIFPLLVIRPGHCYLAYYTDDTKTKLRFLETTVLSDDSFIKKAKTPQALNDAYIKTFMAATRIAKEDFDKYDKLGQVKLIDVTEYRKVIKPIPVYN